MNNSLRILLFISLGAIYSCDTTSSIDPPDDSFFLKYFGGEGTQEGVDFIANADGTFFLLGNSESANNGLQAQVYVVKADAKGQVVWEKTFGGKGKEIAKDIELTTDGKLVVVANTEVTPVDTDIFLLTLTLDGVKIDSTVYGFAGSNENVSSVTQTNDGFIVAGSTTNVGIKPTGAGGGGDTHDAMHIRFNANLSIYPNIWGQANGYNDSFDASSKVIQINANEFYVFGHSNTIEGGGGDYNYWIFKLGPTGVATNRLFRGSSTTDDYLSGIAVAPPQSGDGYILSGTSVNKASGASDLSLIKLRKTITFDANGQDFQFEKTVNSTDLKSGPNGRTAVFASISSNYFVLSDESRSGNSNFYLTKRSSDGNAIWDEVLFGGDGEDRVGALTELPDGKIVMIGTMAIGKNGETKMALLKVNAEGRFVK